MPIATQSRASILRRLAQLESELRRARAELKNLRAHDPATAEVVMRGARLSRERTALERRLELLRPNAVQESNMFQLTEVETRNG